MRIGAWLPDEWERGLTARERELVEHNDLDLLLIPENHDEWEHRDRWKQYADEMETAIYAGFDDRGWGVGLLYDPETESQRVYTKHTTSEYVAFERNDWAAETYLAPEPFGEINLGLSICHDHYVSLLMRYESLNDASVLLNLTGSPVVRKKWGELLQARAIENNAYVVCTLHGFTREGKRHRTNNAHVFAFDPFGDTATLTEAGTGAQRSPFNTEPGNIYYLDIDSDLVGEASRTKITGTRKSEINRVRENTTDVPATAESTLSANSQANSITLQYGGDEKSVEIGESKPFSLAGNAFYIASITAENLFEPERLYRDLFSQEDIDDRTVLLLNHWPELDESYRRSVVEPVVRARALELCSPALLTSRSGTYGYQLANTAKHTHQLTSDRNGWFHFETKRAWGLDSALKPIHRGRRGCYQMAKDGVSDLAEACEQIRLNRRS